MPQQPSSRVFTAHTTFRLSLSVPSLPMLRPTALSLCAQTPRARAAAPTSFTTPPATWSTTLQRWARANGFRTANHCLSPRPEPGHASCSDRRSAAAAALQRPPLCSLLRVARSHPACSRRHRLRQDQPRAALLPRPRRRHHRARSQPQGSDDRGHRADGQGERRGSRASLLRAGRRCCEPPRLELLLLLTAPNPTPFPIRIRRS